MRLELRALVALALLAPAIPAVAQDYPNRPIRVIASQGAGGLSDTWMRAVADQLGPELGGSVVIEDRPGAAGNIGARACADAAPDGYTFCILPGETITINPHIYKNTGIDAREPFEVPDRDGRDPVPWGDRVERARAEHARVTGGRS